MAKSYRDLIVWKKSYNLTLEIYEITSLFPAEERYGLTYQLRKAAVSIPSNIAEGEGRNSNAEFRHFLAIALGSLKEVETQILLSSDIGYIERKVAAPLIEMAAEVGRLINGLSRSPKTEN
jgi:four helix bundle protein